MSTTKTRRTFTVYQTFVLTWGVNQKSERQQLFVYSTCLPRLLAQILVDPIDAWTLEVYAKNIPFLGDDPFRKKNVGNSQEFLHGKTLQGRQLLLMLLDFRFFWPEVTFKGALGDGRSAAGAFATTPVGYCHPWWSGAPKGSSYHRHMFHKTSWLQMNRRIVSATLWACLWPWHSWWFRQFLPCSIRGEKRWRETGKNLANDQFL